MLVRADVVAIATQRFPCPCFNAKIMHKSEQQKRIFTPKQPARFRRRQKDQDTAGSSGNKVAGRAKLGLAETGPGPPSRGLKPFAAMDAALARERKPRPDGRRRFRAARSREESGSPGQV